MMARLFLSGIHGEGRHGARPGEKDNAQPFVVDLDLEVEVGSDRITPPPTTRCSERARDCRGGSLI
jgi:dihydroneopterin aldolase